MQARDKRRRLRAFEPGDEAARDWALGGDCSDGWIRGMDWKKTRCHGMRALTWGWTMDMGAGLQAGLRWGWVEMTVRRPGAWRRGSVKVLCRRDLVTSPLLEA